MSKNKEYKNQESRNSSILGSNFLDSCKGFSLIESMIATAIVGIGFVGVYSLVALSEQFMKWSVARQKLQMQASQMLEIIESDQANIDNYDGVNLENCTSPGGATDTYLVRSYEWCIRMQDEVGDAGDDTRSISVTTMADGKKLVQIVLEAYGGKAQVAMTRMYDVE